MLFQKRVGCMEKKKQFDASSEQEYGNRGDNAVFYYLSPWEFVQWWKVDRLKPPTTDSRTQWTSEGLQYCIDNAGNRQPEAPIAGKHYIVKDSSDVSV